MPELDTQQLVITRDPWGKLHLQDPGATSSREIVPIRMFPISDPDHWVSLCAPSGKEIVTIESLTDLPLDTRELLEEELSSHEFFPVIERVLHVSSLSEPCEWTVLTDRGPTKFVLKSEQDVRRLGPHRAFLVDAHGIRYLIRDSQQMDPQSRQYVEWYL